MPSKYDENEHDKPVELKSYHGPYKYKDKDRDSIDMVTKYQMEDMKGFKGAKLTNTEWLTKKNPVNQMTNPEYHPHKGQEDI